MRILSGGGRPFLHPQADDRAELILWGAATGRELLRIPGLKGSVHGVAFSPDGTRIAAASGYFGLPIQVEGRVTLWDAREGTMLQERT
jgi:WD40 repeat protein